MRLSLITEFMAVRQTPSSTQLDPNSIELLRSRWAPLTPARRPSACSASTVAVTLASATDGFVSAHSSFPAARLPRLRPPYPRPPPQCGTLSDWLHPDGPPATGSSSNSLLHPARPLLDRLKLAHQVRRRHHPHRCTRTRA
jgi:hypothetical protein